ncbi:MAG: acyltransferase [Sphingobium sp.]
MNRQLTSLTSARGIAAWLVVAYHLRASTPWVPAPIMAVLHKSYLAVDFFFLLSGFVIYLSAHKAFERDGPRALPAFLVRRIARIYPLYIVILLATVLFAAAIHAVGGDATSYPLGELPLHMTMMQNWGFTPRLSWNHPAWSISTEFAAYLLFPLIVLASPIARLNRTALLAGMMCVLALLAGVLQVGGQTGLGQDVTHSGLIRCLCEFICGNLLCAFYLRSDPGDGRLLVASLFGLVTGALLWAVGVGGEIALFPAITACLILTLALLSQRWAMTRVWPLHWRPIVYLGEISYATYLAHFMLFILFKILLVDDAANIAPGMIALFLCGLLLLSIILHEGIEKPGRRLAQPLLARLVNGENRHALMRENGATDGS